MTANVALVPLADAEMPLPGKLGSQETNGRQELNAAAVWVQHASK
jgi:hypothetical protein